LLSAQKYFTCFANREARGGHFSIKCTTLSTFSTVLLKPLSDEKLDEKSLNPVLIEKLITHKCCFEGCV